MISDCRKYSDSLFLIKYFDSLVYRIELFVIEFSCDIHLVDELHRFFSYCFPVHL